MSILMQYTVSKLKADLEGLPDDALVILSRDSEGNRHSPLCGVDSHYRYQEHNSFCGEIGLDKLTSRFKEHGYTEEDVAPKDARECVVLWPTI